MVAEGTHPYPSIHIIPTLRPDAAVYNIHLPAWRRSVEDVCGLESHPCDFDSYLLALDARHEYFVKYGAVCTDHSPPALATLPLNDDTHHAAGCRFIEAFDHHGRGVTESDSREFEAYMLRALAGMSARHGLAMQLHPVVARNHNQKVFDEYGPDHGGDMPLPCEFVRNLGPLLEAWGNHEQFKLIISTLDQSCYGQLAALSRGWPAVVTAGPWWWNDRKRGMLTYADEVLGVGGWRNCVGFPDDTRSLPSILARHEVWRRAIALWLSELVSDHQITMEEAGVMMFGLCFGQADAMLTRRTK
jgi:glucuronate isomerase